MFTLKYRGPSVSFQMCSVCNSATPMEATRSKLRQIAISAPKHFQSRTDSSSFPFLSSLAICFLTINTVIAAVRSRSDPWAFSFVVSVYVLLMILFWLLRVYDRRSEGSEEKDRLKIPIWAVATALNIVFAYRVGMIMNLAGQCFVWGMAAITSFIGFYMFFIYPTSNGNAPNPVGAKNCDGRCCVHDSKI